MLSRLPAVSILSVAKCVAMFVGLVGVELSSISDIAAHSVDSHCSRSGLVDLCVALCREGSFNLDKRVEDLSRQIVKLYDDVGPLWWR